MRRRQVGIAGLQRSAQAKDAFRSMGDQLAASQLVLFQDLIIQFRSSLESFAQRHRKAITKDPRLRIYFQQMCASIGVDPFTNSKGFWNEMLGLGDYFYDLGMRLVEHTLTRRDVTGGVFRMAELCDALKTSETDLKRAISLLQPLGGGFQVLDLMQETCLATIPKELNMDANQLLLLIQGATLGIQTREAAAQLGWEEKRVELVMLLLINEGQVWIDQHETLLRYYYYDCFLDSTEGVFT